LHHKNPIFIKKIQISDFFGAIFWIFIKKIQNMDFFGAKNIHFFHRNLINFLEFPWKFGFFTKKIMDFFGAI
jgi:hypothetical protein